MMNGQRQTAVLPQASVNSFNIPLLDDEFDPGEEEIFDHSDLTLLHFGQHESEDFSEAFAL
jgi:hypothetical protein